MKMQNIEDTTITYKFKYNIDVIIKMVLYNNLGTMYNKYTR